MNRPFLLAASLLSLSACAGEREMRGVAAQSASFLTEYSKSMADFSASQTRLNKETASRLAQLGKMRDMRRAEISARTASWRIEASPDSEGALKRFAAISDVATEEVLATVTPSAGPVAVQPLKYDGAGTDAVIKGLVALREPIPLRKRLEHLFDFSGAAVAAYRDGVAADSAGTVAAAEQTKARAEQESAPQASGGN